MKKRKHRYIKKYNTHLSNQKSIKRLVGYLRNNMIAFSIQYKDSNNIKGITQWIDIYEKGNWNLTKRQIRREFKREFDFGCYSKKQPKLDSIDRGKPYTLIWFRMNIDYELAQSKDLSYKEYTLLCVLLKTEV